MSKTRARKISRAQEMTFWGRIRAGDSTERASITAGFDSSHGDGLFAHAGGMTPKRVREIHPRYLSIRERERILMGVTRGDSIRQIARDLGRSPATIWNELRRNRGRRPKYRPRYRTRPPQSTDWYSPSHAQRRAELRLARPKPQKLELNPRLGFVVFARLQLGHSPVQIMQRLRMDFPDDPSMQVSHEAIYRSIYVQGNGELRKELAGCLRSGRARRVPRERARRQRTEHRPGKIPGMVMISERPAEVLDRAVPGHWEGDLIIGKNNASQIGTLVERSTRFVILLHLPERREAVTVANAMVREMGHLPDHLRRSITWDQGHEMADHARLARELDLRDGVYFCDPHSPWQRGTNENTNGLLRQYFPKGTDLSGHSQRYLDAVAAELNARPRQTLGWHTPAEAIAKILGDDTGVHTIP